MVLLKIHPKKQLNFLMNEYGDVYLNDQHIGELIFQPNTGITGKTGPTGPNSIGLKGYKGPIGDIGETGPTGLSIVGLVGDIGDNGPKGCIGKIGPRGMTGDIGPTGEIGDKGPPMYKYPRNFLYAKIDKQYQYTDDKIDYKIIPWYHIANNGFVIKNNVISFPKKYGVYKIECGLQITNFSNEGCIHNSDTLEGNSIQLELCFTKQQYCKSNVYIIPYCQKQVLTVSNCETVHHIYTVTEETDMVICIKTCGKIQDIQDTMFLSIMEIF